MPNTGEGGVRTSRAGGGDSGYSDTGNVTGDIVLSQSETTYDAGKVLSVLSRERFHDASGTGALGGSRSALARRTASGSPLGVQAGLRSYP